MRFNRFTLLIGAAGLSLAAVSTAAFQIRLPSCQCQPIISTMTRANDRTMIKSFHLWTTFVWGPLSYASKTNDNDISSETVPALSIHSLLEEGRVGDAAAELRKSGKEVPPSTYHAVIEACCAGGFERRKRQKRMASKNDQIETAAELLQTMEDGATAHAHEILIAGYARRGRWQDAYRTLSSMEETFCPSDEAPENNNRQTRNESKDALPSLNVYQLVLVAFAKANQFNHMNSLLTRMRRRGVRPNVYTFNALLKICASDKVPRWREALSLLSQCQREPGVNPDLITYTTAMKACARARQEDKARELFRAAKDMGLELDVYFYTTAMDASAKGRKRHSWKNALRLLDEMKEEGMAPNEVTYGVAVAACGNGGQWRRALELLDEMRAMDLKINTIAYNSAIAALSKAARTELKQHQHQGNAQRRPDSAELLWEQALDIIQCMEREGVQRDSFTFSSAISTCGAAGKWQEAVNLIEAMKGEGIKPNKVAYTAAITACANSRQWDPAFELFNDVKNDGIKPDIVAYNALIGAGMAANKPDEVLELWLEMCQGNEVSPDIVTLTEVIGTLDGVMGNANRERVDSIFSEAVTQGLILRKDSLDTSWEVDLSSMSFPVARAACRYIFRQIVQRSSIIEDEGGDDGAAVKDLSLITGASRMREYVRGVLRDEFKPAVYCVVPEFGKGTLLVKAKMMQNYIKGQSQQ